LKDRDLIAFNRLRQRKDRINLQEFFLSREKVKGYGVYSGTQFTFNPMVGEVLRETWFFNLRTAYIIDVIWKALSEKSSLLKA
jgi:hypothetical protein